MGKQVSITFVCDVCKKAIDEESALSGELKANRRRWNMHLHKDCLEKLTSEAEKVARKRRRRRRKTTAKKKA